MPDIPGQKLSVDQSGFMLTQRTVEETAEQINTTFDELGELNYQLFQTMRGELVLDFLNAMHSIEANIKETEKKLRTTAQEMYWYGNQFIQIDSNAGQHAGGTVK